MLKFFRRKQKKVEPSILHVKSFDFDGCLYNEKYHNIVEACKSPHDPSLVIHSNAIFLDKLRDEFLREKASEVIMMVGSARQSPSLDYSNSTNKNTESCFLSLLSVAGYFQKILKKVKVCVDDFLMADLYLGKKNGTHFNEDIQKNLSTKAMDPAYKVDILCDTSKLTLLYAQMQKMASENPNKKIVFDFYDDLLGLLIPLQAFFQKHPDWIPSNLTLRLNLYDGESLDRRSTIQGTGKSYPSYKENVKKILLAAGAEAPFYSPDVDKKSIDPINVYGEIKDQNLDDLFTPKRYHWRPIKKAHPIPEISCEKEIPALKLT